MNDVNRGVASKTTEGGEEKTVVTVVHKDPLYNVIATPPRRATKLWAPVPALSSSFSLYHRLPLKSLATEEDAIQTRIAQLAHHAILQCTPPVASPSLALESSCAVTDDTTAPLREGEGEEKKLHHRKERTPAMPTLRQSVRAGVSTASHGTTSSTASGNAGREEEENDIKKKHTKGTKTIPKEAKEEEEQEGTLNTKKHIRQEKSAIKGKKEHGKEEPGGPLSREEITMPQDDITKTSPSSSFAFPSPVVEVPPTFVQTYRLTPQELKQIHEQDWAAYQMLSKYRQVEDRSIPSLHDRRTSHGGPPHTQEAARSGKAAAPFEQKDAYDPALPGSVVHSTAPLYTKSYVSYACSPPSTTPPPLPPYSPDAVRKVKMKKKAEEAEAEVDHDEEERRSTGSPPLPFWFCTLGGWRKWWEDVSTFPRRRTIDEKKGKNDGGIGSLTARSKTSATVTNRSTMMDVSRGTSGPKQRATEGVQMTTGIRKKEEEKGTTAKTSRAGVLSTRSKRQDKKTNAKKEEETTTATSSSLQASGEGATRLGLPSRVWDLLAHDGDTLPATRFHTSSLVPPPTPGMLAGRAPMSLEEVAHVLYLSSKASRSMFRSVLPTHSEPYQDSIPRGRTGTTHPASPRAPSRPLASTMMYPVERQYYHVLHMLRQYSATTTTSPHEKGVWESSSPSEGELSSSSSILPPGASGMQDAMPTPGSMRSAHALAATTTVRRRPHRYLTPQFRRDIFLSMPYPKHPSRLLFPSSFSPTVASSPSFVEDKKSQEGKGRTLSFGSTSPPLGLDSNTPLSPPWNDPSLPIRYETLGEGCSSLFATRRGCTTIMDPAAPAAQTSHPNSPVSTPDAEEAEDSLQRITLSFFLHWESFRLPLRGGVPYSSWPRADVTRHTPSVPDPPSSSPIPVPILLPSLLPAEQKDGAEEWEQGWKVRQHVTEEEETMHLPRGRRRRRRAFLQSVALSFPCAVVHALPHLTSNLLVGGRLFSPLSHLPLTPEDGEEVAAAEQRGHNASFDSFSSSSTPHTRGMARVGKKGSDSLANEKTAVVLEGGRQTFHVILAPPSISSSLLHAIATPSKKPPFPLSLTTAVSSTATPLVGILPLSTSAEQGATGSVTSFTERNEEERGQKKKVEVQVVMDILSSPSSELIVVMASAQRPSFLD